MRAFLLSVIFLCLLVPCGAQSFHKGAVVLDLNTGFEVYNTMNSYSIRRSDQKHDTTVKDIAGNGNFAMGVEIGIRKRFGIGLRGKTNTFFRNVDAVTHNRADIRTTDMLLILTYHPFIRNKFDMVIGADLGFSIFNSTSHDIYSTVVKGNGAFAGIYLNPRFYFKRFGVNFKTYVPYINYSALSSEQSQADRYIISKWQGSGFGISIGVQYRFFKP
jgi:hypothetical protein